MIQPSTLLDIGCGSGRLFPIYENIDQVFAQNVSKIELKMSQKKYLDYKIDYLYTGLKKLNFHHNYFDLIISNRVLAATLPGKIDTTLHKLSQITKCFYVNEMTDSDYHGESSPYWFKHLVV